MNLLFKLLPVFQALKFLIIYPFWYMFHKLYFIPRIRREAKFVNMEYDDYINKLYMYDAESCKQLFKEVNE